MPLPPGITVRAVVPAAGGVSVAGMWWRFPAAAIVFVTPIAFAPVFINPHVAWAWGFGPYHNRMDWTDVHIYLC